MSDLVFPLSSEQQTEAKASCPVCKAPIGHGFAFICGGAIAEEAPENLSEPAPSTGFLTIGVHGAHLGDLTAPSAHLDLFADAPLGQFERSVCSSACLRALLNLAVDRLETRLSRGVVV